MWFFRIFNLKIFRDLAEKKNISILLKFEGEESIFLPKIFIPKENFNLIIKSKQIFKVFKIFIKVLGIQKIQQIFNPIFQNKTIRSPKLAQKRPIVAQPSNL